MHVYKIMHGGDFNKHDNFSFTKLFYAQLQILKRDLHGNENGPSVGIGFLSLREQCHLSCA